MLFKIEQFWNKLERNMWLIMLMILEALFHQICLKTIKENNIWIEKTINQSMLKFCDPLSQNML